MLFSHRHSGKIEATNATLLYIAAKMNSISSEKKLFRADEELKFRK
jgi:hypothetical protein